MKSLWLISILFLLAAGCVTIKPKGLIRDEIGMKSGHGTRAAGQIRDTGHGTESGHGTLDTGQIRDTGRGTDPGHGTRDTGQIRDTGQGRNMVNGAMEVGQKTQLVEHQLSGVTLYKATLDIKKHHLTGLLVIKRMDSATSPGNIAVETSPVYRIVFANEIGMTFFDLELKADSFKVISCFESLKRKALMKIFETDFRLLTGINKSVSKASYVQACTGNRVIEGRSGRYKTWQTFSPSGDTCFMHTGKSTIADPVFITYLNYKDGFPMKTTIENPFIGMKLSLRLLDRK